MSYVENRQKNLASQKIQNYIKSFKKGKESNMKGLSKEERLQQRIEELERLIEAKCDEYSNKKWLRVKRTCFVLSSPIYLIELFYALSGRISDINIETICGLLFSPLVAAGIIMFISYGIMYYITENAIKEEIEVAKKIGELNAVKSEKYNNFEDEKIKELERHIDYLENYYAHKCDDCTILKLLNEVEEDGED